MVLRNQGEVHAAGPCLGIVERSGGQRQAGEPTLGEQPLDTRGAQNPLFGFVRLPVTTTRPSAIPLMMRVHV